MKAVVLSLGFVALTTGCADVRAPRPRAAVAEPAAGATDVGTYASRGDAATTDASPPTDEGAPSTSMAAQGAAFKLPVPSELAEDAPAVRYARLGEKACKEELGARGVAFREAEAAGVTAPVRLPAEIRGVKLVMPGEKSAHGIVDCSLALALDDFVKLLSERGVVRVRVDNVFRKGARIGGRGKPSQHALALAIDIDHFELAGGRRIGPSAWGASIGQTPCGPEAVMPTETDDAVFVRDLLCEAGRRGLFHSILTPSFDAAHQSHFHLDLKRGDTRRMFVR